MKKTVALFSFLFVFCSQVVMGASSLFDTVYAVWRSNTVLHKSKQSIPTFIPHSELFTEADTGKRFLIHLNALNKPFAVEYVFSDSSKESLSSDRSYEKQFCGMILWSLEQEDDAAFWIYINSTSVQKSTTFLKVDKTLSEKVHQLYKDKKATFNYKSLNGAAKLTFSTQKDTLLTLWVKPKLIDLLGFDQEEYASYVIESLQSGIVTRSEYQRGNSENFSSDKGMISFDGLKEEQVNSKEISSSEFKDYPEAKVLMKNWLEKSFTLENFLENSSTSIRIVSRDTVDFEEKKPAIELINQLQLVLSSNKEQAAIGFVSGEKFSETKERIRFLVIYRNSEMGYEHVLRIDHFLEKHQSKWLISESKILVMVINPLEQINS